MDKLPDDNILEITIPTIRFVGIYEPITLQIDKAYLKLFVRIVVVWCTFLLFKPRMAKAWKVMFGDDDEEKQKEILAKIAKLEAERDKAAGGATGKKSYAVATGPGGKSAPATPASATTSTEKGSAKRRKA